MKPTERHIDFKLLLSGYIRDTTQPAFNCSKLLIETIEKGEKYVQS